MTGDLDIAKPHKRWFMLPCAQFDAVFYIRVKADALKPANYTDGVGDLVSYTSDGPMTIELYSHEAQRPDGNIMSPLKFLIGRQIPEILSAFDRNGEVMHLLSLQDDVCGMVKKIRRMFSDHYFNSTNISIDEFITTKAKFDQFVDLLRGYPIQFSSIDLPSLEMRIAGNEKHNLPGTPANLLRLDTLG